MISFLSLPAEIRQMIYAYALVVGNVAPYRPAYLASTASSDYHGPFDYYDPIHYHDPWDLPLFHLPDFPAVDLLKTCRQINAEASPTLYSKNHWILGPTAWTVRFFENALGTEVRRSWVKSVLLWLRAEDMSDEEIQEVEWDSLGKTPEASIGHDKIEDEASHQLWHDSCIRYLREVSWPRKVGFILEYLALDALKVNISLSTCIATGCNLQASAIAAFADGFKYGMPLYFKICGMKRWKNQNIEGLVREWTDQRGKTSLPVSEGLMVNARLIRRIEGEIVADKEIPSA